MHKIQSNSKALFFSTRASVNKFQATDVYMLSTTTWKQSENKLFQFLFALKVLCCLSKQPRVGDTVTHSTEVFVAKSKEQAGVLRIGG